MQLIHLLVPGLFFILSLLEVRRGGSNVSLGLPKHWEQKSLDDAGIEDSLCGLEFISEVPQDLNKLRNRVRYVYVKGQ
jgi:hypothetical protein